MLNAFVIMFSATDDAADSSSSSAGSGSEPKRRLQYADQAPAVASNRSGKEPASRSGRHPKRESETFFDAISLVPPELSSKLLSKEAELTRLLYKNKPLDAHFTDSKTFSLLMSNSYVATVQLGEDGVEVLDWKVEKGLAAAMERTLLSSSSSSSGSSSAPSSPAKAPPPRVGFAVEQSPVPSAHATPRPEPSCAGLLAKSYAVVCSMSARLLLFKAKKKGRALDFAAPAEIVCAKKLKLNQPALQISVNFDSDLMIVLTGTEVLFLHFDAEFKLHSLGFTALPMQACLQVAWVPQKPRTVRVFGQNDTETGYHVSSQTLLMPDPVPGVDLIFGPLATLQVSAPVTAVATATHDPDLCVIATQDGCLLLVDLRDSLALRSTSLPAPAFTLRFHPVGGIIVAATGDGSLIFLDLALHRLELQRDLFQRQETLDFSSVCDRRLNGSPLALWFPPSPTPGESWSGLDTWIEGSVEAMVDSLLVVWEHGPASVLALDLGPVAGGRWGAQEVCACWLARGQWSKAEDLIWSSNGRQRQGCASLLLHGMLRECFNPGQLDPSKTSPAAFCPVAVDGAVRPRGGVRPTRQQFALLLSRISQLAQDSGEGVLHSLVADVTRRLYFWSLSQGDLQTCEQIATERGEADLWELLVVWAGRAEAKNKQPQVDVSGAGLVADKPAEKGGAAEWDGRSRGEVGERVHRKAMQELEKVVTQAGADVGAVANPGAVVGRGGVWEQERDRRSLKQTLDDHHLAGLVETALRLDIEGGHVVEIQAGQERELHLLSMLHESRGLPSREFGPT